MKRYTMGWRDLLIKRAPPWARRTLGPSASYLDMLLVDHGIFRLVYNNRHRLGRNAWRSAQPAPHNVRSIARKGVRTIVNLRGPRTCGAYWLEEQACRQAGVKLINFVVRSRAAPSKEDLYGARALFQSIEYPMLMHCKSGADRAGLMSTLYLHICEGLPVEEARAQLSIRFGHIRQADTGILDFFIDRYIADNKRSPIAFFDWVEKVYDPDEVTRAFSANRWANVLINTVLRRE